MRERKGLAAFGVKSDDFTPQAATGFDFVNQILPFLSLIFPVTDSKRALRVQKTAYEAPPPAPFTQLVASRRME